MRIQHDAKYVAKHLAVDEKTLARWVLSPTAKFPAPVSIVQRIDNYPDVVLWDHSQLPLLREWLGKRLNLIDPQGYWRAVDEGAAPSTPQGQLAMFSA